MYKLLCWLSIIIFSAHTIHPAQKTFSHCYYHTANILIMIDEQEETGLTGKHDVVSWALKDALEDQCCVLIVSNHLLNNIDYFSLPDQKNWSIRRVSENISVLVSNNLAVDYRARGIVPPEIKDDSDLGINLPRYDLSKIDDDHILGIHFSLYPELKKDNLSSKTIGKNNLSREATDALIKLFIPRSDYWQLWHGKVPPRIYNLLFFGHGLEPVVGQVSSKNPILAEGRVSGFVTHDMNRLLFALINIINSATIISCFSGDINQLAVFNKNSSRLAESRSFPFPIIMATPLASATTVFGVKNNFANFFTELTDNCDHPDFAKALRYIYKATSSNIPVIKYPNLPVFFPLDPRIYGEIGFIMVKARTEPLSIPSYFGQKKLLAILVHPAQIPFRVILDPGQEQLTPFFSAEPGPRIHEFSGGLDGHAYSFSKIIEAFASSQQFEWKVFSFSTITAQDDTAKKDNLVREFKNVAIINHLETDPETNNQTPIVLLTYTLDGQIAVFEKTIAISADTATLGGDLQKKSVKLTKDTQDTITKLIKNISQMAQNPTLTNPDLLVPQIEQVSDFLKKHIESYNRDFEIDRLLNKLAKSLKILAQP